MEHAEPNLARVQDDDDGSWRVERGDWKQSRTFVSRALAHFWMKLALVSRERAFEHLDPDSPSAVFLKSLEGAAPARLVLDGMGPASKRPSLWLMAGVSMLIVGVPFLAVRYTFELVGIDDDLARIATAAALSLAVFWILRLFGRDHSLRSD